MLIALFTAFTAIFLGFKSDISSIYNITIITATSIMLVAVILFKYKTSISVPILIIPFSVLLLVIIIYAVCSNYNTAGVIWKTIYSFILYFFLCVLSNNNTKQTILYTTLILYGIFEAIYGLTQLSQSSLGMFGHFDNPVGLASVLSGILPYSLYFIFCDNNKKRILGIVSFIIIVSSIILTKSRAAIIASTAILVIVTIWIYANQIVDISKKIKIAIAVFLLPLITVGTIFIYKSKQDSADGRILIWASAVSMIKDKALIGYGINSFDVDYMLYQAQYFEEHPNSKYANLASNIKHPFNEYLLLTIEYGIIGVVIMGTVLYYILSNGCKSMQEDKFFALLSIMSISIIRLFSYPLKYITVVSLAIIALFVISQGRSWHIKYKYTVLTIICCLIISSTSYSVEFTRKHKLWHNAISQYPIDYSKLEELRTTSNFFNNLEFLYNYAALLNRDKFYEKSIIISNQLMRYSRDYDTIILLIDNLYRIGNYAETRKYAQIAANMCPNRFIPSYYLVMAYHKTGLTNHAIHLARQVLAKPVKVKTTDSFKVKYIRQEYIHSNTTNH